MPQKFDLQTKDNNITQQIKGVDSKQGVVEIYVNAFDNEDTDGDISVRGSFAKTIQENMSRIKHFLNHNMTNLIGVPLELIEDEHGLLARSQLNLNKQIGRDVLEDYKLYSEHGKTLEHSIGVEPLKRDESDKRYVKEWRLWEFSTLYGWGANADTPLVGIKSMDEAKKLFELMLEKGNYSEKRMKSIEKRLEQTKALLNEPSQDTHKYNQSLLNKLRETEKILKNG